MEKGRSSNETGDIRNLENFQDYIIHCQNLEPVYAPMNDRITTKEMDKHSLRAWDAYEDLRTKRYDFILVTNRRQDVFEGLAKLATRLNGAVSGGGYDQRTVADFKTITRKIQGRLSKPKTYENQPNQELSSGVSNSQRSYDQYIDNFADAIRFLERLGNFEPNEEYLQIASLQGKLEEMRLVNKEVYTVFSPYVAALDVRDDVFYGEKNGFLVRVKESKQYLKSVYGYGSPEFKEGNKIRFVTLNKRRR